MEQRLQPHGRLTRLLRPSVVSFGAITFLMTLLVCSGLWVGAAEANPNPSTTPSVAPIPGASGLYMFTNSSGFTKELRQINLTDGDASTPFPTTTTQNLKGVAQDPVTRIVWAVTGNCNLYAVDMATGALSAATPASVVLPSPYSACESLAIDGNQVFYIAMKDTSVTPSVLTWGTFDATTGVATVRWNPVSPPESATSMSYDPVTQAVYFFAVRGAAPTYYGWFKITAASTTAGTGSSIPSSALAISPTGVAYNDAVDSASNITNFLAGVTTFVGYPNSQTAYNNTLFWYQAATPTPAPPTPTPAALANTGIDSFSVLLTAVATIFVGSFIAAVAQILMRRKWELKDK